MKFKKFFLILVLCVGGLEIGTRYLGVLDFPIYDVDQDIGYIPAKEQSGCFLNKNRWQLNEKHLGAGDWEPNGDKDCLLIGDSLVWGGNPYDHNEKLGYLLQKQLNGYKVWPAAAGSWGVLNEITYLERFKDVTAEADVLIWVFNDGDFDERTQWTSEISHPTKKPVSSLWYIVEKNILPRFAPVKNPVNPVADTSNSGVAIQSFYPYLSKLKESRPNLKVLLLAYPSKSTVEQAGGATFTRLIDILKSEKVSYPVLNLLLHKEWNSGFYKDDIHMTVEGNAKLAEIMANNLDIDTK